MIENLKEGSRGTRVLKVTKQEDEYIKSICIDEQSQSAFVATSNNTINQINLRSGKRIKRYSDMGITYIYCLTSFEHLLCATGSYGNFTLINMFERRLLTIKPIRTRIGRINCCQFTILNRNNHPTIVLIVSGRNSFLLYLYLQIHYFIDANKSLKGSYDNYDSNSKKLILIISRVSNQNTYYIR